MSPKSVATPRPTNKFLRVDSDPPTWHIQMAGESCVLSGPEGLERIREVLGGPDTGTLEYVWTAGKRAIQREVYMVNLAIVVQKTAPESTRAITPGRLTRFIVGAELRAKQALASGDKPEYDRLMVEVQRIRAYQTTTRAHAGKSRTFANENSRGVDAVRKAIARSITEIRKRCPAIADHFKATILYGGDGCWFYDGDHSAWDLASPLPDWIRDDTDGDNPGGCEPVTLIREAWGIPRPLAANKRAAVLGQMRARVWWEVGPETTKTNAANSFRNNRPAYISDLITSEVHLEDEIEIKNIAEKETENTTGDDRAPEDFESER